MVLFIKQPDDLVGDVDARAGPGRFLQHDVEVFLFGNLLGMFQGSTMGYSLSTKSLRLFAEEVLPRFRGEVYEPWLAERGLKKLLLPKGGRRPGPGPVSDSGTAAGTAITGVRHDEPRAA